MSVDQVSEHVGTVEEFPMNLPAYRWKFTCAKCHWQSYQETKASAEAIGASHQRQYGSGTPQTEVAVPVLSTAKTETRDGVTTQTTQVVPTTPTAQPAKVVQPVVPTQPAQPTVK